VKSIALLAVLVALAVAQHWEFEQVDSGVIGGPTVARMPDGRMCVSYVAADSAVWVAFKDTVWHREVVGKAEGGVSPAIAVGVHGTVGVVYDTNGICYAVRGDTAWVRDHLPPAGLGPRLSYDSADVPLVVSGCGRGMDVYVYATRRADTGWATATLLVAGPGFYLSESHTTGRFSSDNVAHVFVHDYWELEPFAWDSRFTLFEGYGDTWRVSWDSSLPSPFYEAQALALDTSGVPVFCFIDYEGRLLLAGQYVDSVARHTALQIDSLNRPHVAYIANLWYPGRLKYAYRTRLTWFIVEVPDTCAVVGCDLLLDTIAEPVIAYVRSDGGLWLARGVDVVGQSEDRQQPTAIGQQLTASVIRNVLLLPEAASPRPQAASLMDISGKKVLDLKAGANDVSGLAPGVYFVRQEPHASSHKPQAVTKVVVTR